MPSETWLSSRLGDYATVIMGQSPESDYYTQDPKDTPFLQGNRTFGHKYPSFDTYTSKVTKIAPADSVLVSVRAPVGDTNMSPTEVCLGRGVAALTSIDPDNEFLYYLIKSLTPVLNQNENGSTFGSINKSDLEKLPIQLPDYSTRSIIGRILSLLDRKIDTNQAINDNLLAIANAQFKNILDNEAPSSVKISDLCLSITDGVHNTVVDDPYGPALLLSCKNIKDGQLTIGNNERTISRETFEKLRKRTKLASGDILLTSVGTIGETYLMIDEPVNIEFQRSVALIKPDQTKISPEYLYLAINSVKDSIINAAHGAVQQCLFINDVCSIEVPCISTESIDKLTQFVRPLFNQINHNRKESFHLSRTRDYLLPKLMSGEIDVSALELPS